ncbi:ORF20A [Fowl aviadenovirus B]|uniref:ORF20A n=1 Tax=Fowl aviadenovirus B TaxID=190062 RepID=A0A4Y5G365_9ADEN|nr:ORF20A [Fowl aviadenovirus B]
MPLCSDSVWRRRHRRKACVIAVASIAGALYCSVVICSYLFLSGHIDPLSYVFVVFGCCTFLDTSLLILLLLAWKYWGDTGDRPTSRRHRFARPPPSDRPRTARRLFPFGGPQWTVSSNPWYTSLYDRPLPPIPLSERLYDLPLPPIPLSERLQRVPLLPLSSRGGGEENAEEEAGGGGGDGEEVYGGSSSDEERHHVYDEIVTVV